MPLKSATLRVVGTNDIVNYSYLLSNKESNSSLIIDPAWDLEKIEQAAASQNCPIVAVLLTHHHADHVDLADTLASKLDIPVYMNQSEIDTYGFSCTGLIGIESDKLSLAGLDIEVIQTPGHTAGAVSFLVEGNLYSGDTLFIEGCGECVSDGADAGQLFDSLQTLLEKVPPKTRVYPGHRFKRVPGMSMGYVSKNNIFLQTTDKEAFIEYRQRPVAAAGQNYL